VRRQCGSGGDRLGDSQSSRAAIGGCGRFRGQALAICGGTISTIVGDRSATGAACRAGRCRRSRVALAIQSSAIAAIVRDGSASATDGSTFAGGRGCRAADRVRRRAGLMRGRASRCAGACWRIATTIESGTETAVVRDRCSGRACAGSGGWRGVAFAVKRCAKSTVVSGRRGGGSGGRCWSIAASVQRGAESTVVGGG